MITPGNSFGLDEAEINAFYGGRGTHSHDLFGCVPLDGAVRFCLWAPNAASVSVVGDFNNWDETADPCERYRGLWVRIAKNTKNGDNYKYRIVGADGKICMKADPYAVHAETPPGTASKVWDASGYKWRDAAWLRKRAETNLLRSPVSIYELNLGSWRVKEGYEHQAYRETAKELAAYIKEMGFTHVELMPVNEHPFGGSWGYQVTGFFAITSRYGTPQDFMYLVDELHRAGIGVLVDWVPAHFPKDAHGLPHFDGTWLYEHANPLRREHPQWGTYEFNYNRPEVISFLISSAVSLIERYHIDGLRVDAVSSMLYLDYGRENDFIHNKDGGNIDYEAVDFLKNLNTAILGGHPGVCTVAEESTAYPLVTKPPFDGGLGFTFKWNMGFMHDTLDFCRTDPYFRHGSHDKLTFSMHYAFAENYILPYSHDEVVHGKASMIGKMHGDYDQKFAALKLLYGWLYGHPGKKLLFMGDEFAQFIEWDYEKQLDWFLLEYESHQGVQAWVRALNRLYVGHPALYSKDDSWEGFQWLNVCDKENSVFAFRRTDGDRHIVCVYNFTPAAHATYDVALPAAGTLTLLLSSNEADYGGTGESGKTGGKVKKRVQAKAAPLNGQPCSAALALPPLTALFYEYAITKRG
ncbi:MAG: 1,4-alpha-glucan branching protein GlgB [Clostridiales Family XIII bacterium]|jgi:1,4-alpha-glucan branching enzyme|nr:1,4-alpha-glucan branching protein GlgB [Clostridiales Family XIII bacterium]